MDPNGRLIITKGNEETFRGKSFEENGLRERGENRHERRKREAELRKLKQLVADQSN